MYRPQHRRESGAFVPVPSVQAWIGARCALPSGDGAAAVSVGIVARRLADELRERRGLSYSPSAYAADGLLTVSVSTDPANAAVALGLIEAALRAPEEQELRVAQAEALGSRSPAHLAPEDLATSLAFGSVSPDAVTGWEDAVRSSTVASIGSGLEACRKGWAWAVSGPAGTVVPEGTPTLDPAALATELRP